MPVITVDKEFNELMNRDIKEKISYAFISLSANFNKLGPGPLSESELKIVEDKADQMKNEINHFIDLQVEMLTGYLGSKKNNRVEQMIADIKRERIIPAGEVNEKKGDENGMVEPYKPLYTIKQAAAVLLVSPNTVYRFINSGALPYVPIGSKKIRGADLEKFISTFPVGEGEDYDTKDN